MMSLDNKAFTEAKRVFDQMSGNPQALELPYAPLRAAIKAYLLHASPEPNNNHLLPYNSVKMEVSWDLGRTWASVS